MRRHDVIPPTVPLEVPPSPCAPLVYPWLGEVEGASLAMTQAKASPVPALAPMFRVSPVLRRLPSAVPPKVVER